MAVSFKSMSIGIQDKMPSDTSSEDIRSGWEKVDAKMNDLRSDGTFAMANKNPKALDTIADKMGVRFNSLQETEDAIKTQRYLADTYFQGDARKAMDFIVKAGQTPDYQNLAFTTATIDSAISKLEPALYANARTPVIAPVAAPVAPTPVEISAQPDAASNVVQMPRFDALHPSDFLSNLCNTDLNHDGFTLGDLSDLIKKIFSAVPTRSAASDTPIASTDMLGTMHAVINPEPEVYAQTEPVGLSTAPAIDLARSNVS